MAMLTNPQVYVFSTVADIESIPYSLISMPSFNIFRITERKTHSNSKDSRSCRFLILSTLSFLCLYLFWSCMFYTFIRLHSEFRSIFFSQMSQCRMLVRHLRLVLTPFNGTCVLASQYNTLPKAAYNCSTVAMSQCSMARLLLYTRIFYRCTVQAKSKVTHSYNKTNEMH
jgi:hypothetical protein